MCITIISGAKYDMLFKPWILSIGICIAYIHQPILAQGTLPTSQATVSACFRPNTEAGCVNDIVMAINSAQKEIRVQAYGFTSPQILASLVKAKQRGIDVQVILDKINDPVVKNKIGEDGKPLPMKKSRYSGATYITNANIPTFIDRKPRIAHNKLIIIDQHLVIGGSYNYTTSAEKSNAENVTFIDSSEVASWFLNNWQNRKLVSEVYTPSP